MQSKKIVAIGTSDLDKTQLEQLYQWAQVERVRMLTPATAVEQHASSACSLWLTSTHGSSEMGFI